MRTRSRTFTNLDLSCPTDYYVSLKQDDSGCSPPHHSIPTIVLTQNDYNRQSDKFNVKVSSISDYVRDRTIRPSTKLKLSPKDYRVFVAARAAMRRKAEIARKSIAGRRLRRETTQVHPCSHTSISMSLKQDEITYDTGHGIGCIAATTTYHFANGLTAFKYLINEDPIHYLAVTSKNYTSSSFHAHDWFALTDAFNEACDSFVPSSFLLGEDIAECGIFVDALKLIFNPSRAVPLLIKHVLDAGMEKATLGAIARQIKRSSNALLSYRFGVKPAISDIIAALNAHNEVSFRMQYLRENAGDLIPVHVQRKLPCVVTNFAIPNNSAVIVCDEKSSIASISALARVREDLNFNDTWSAYLQYFGINKIIGLAWELIPFSFVVDWFTNAQERINSLTRLHTGDPFTEVRGLCYTTKTVLEESCMYRPTSINSHTVIRPDVPVKLWTAKSVSYNRSLVSPDVSSVLDFSALGSSQYTSLGALLLQRVLR
jgi:hypothetical protein